MEYSWLENIPSSLTQIPSYEPDFSFLSTMQGKANQQYEAGLSQVKSDYGSIFSQPVTGVVMQQRQQEYAKQAQQKMKDISASDLSDPKNVLAADQVLTPFHQDPFLVKNIGLTASYQAQKGKIDAMRNSKDADQRALYNNPILDRYINQGIEELANAPLTQEAYSKLAPRETIPIHDVQAEGDKAFKEAFGTKGIETTNADGSVMSVTTNGPQSFSQYKTFMSAFQQRPEYAAQNRLIATTLMTDDLNAFKQHPENANLSEEVIRQRFTENIVDQVKHGYTTGITDARKSARESRLKNSSLITTDANGNITGDLTKIPRDIAPQILANIQKAKEYDKMASDLENNFTSQLGYKAPENSSSIVDPQKLLEGFTSDNPLYQKALQDALYHGEDYYQKVYQDDVSNKWAAGRASISSVEYKDNPAYRAAQEQANKEWDQKYKTEELLMRNQQGQQKYSVARAAELRKEGFIIGDDMIEGGISDTPFESTGSSFSSTTAFSGAGQVPHANVASGIPGEPGTDIQKVPTLDIYNKEQADKRNAAFATSLTYQGNLQLFSADNIPGGLSAAQLMDISGQMNQAFTTGHYPTDGTSTANRKQFISLLKDQGVITGNPDEYINVGPGQLAGYSEQLATKYAKTLMGNADPAKRQLGMKIKMQQDERDNLLADYAKQKDVYDTKVKDFIAGDKLGRYTKLLKLDQNGHRLNEFSTAADMIKDFPRVTLQDGKGNYKILEPTEFADLYRRGQVKYDGQLYLGDNPSDQQYKGSGLLSSHSSAWNIVAVGDKKPSDYRYGMDIANDFNKYYTQDKKVDIPMGPNAIDRRHTFIDKNSIQYKYGNSEDIPKLSAEIGEKVISKLPGYSTGLSGSAVTYNMATEPGNKDPNIAQQRETAVQGYQELFRNPKNIVDVYTTDGNMKKSEDIMGNTELMQALNNHTDREAVLDIFGQGQYFPHGPNGKAAWKFTTRLDKSGDRDKSTIEDTKINEIKKKGAIWVDVADNAKGEVLSQLPHPSDLLRYGRVYYDKNGISNSTYEEQAGFKWHIVPDVNSRDGSGRYTKAYVITQKQKVNPNTGVLQTDSKGGIVWAPESSTPIDDLTVYNPDMLKNRIDKWVLATMQENDLRRSTYQIVPQENTVDLTNYVK